LAVEFRIGEEVVILDGSVEHGERGKVERLVPDSSGRVIAHVRLYDDGVIHPTVPAELRRLLGHGKSS